MKKIILILLGAILLNSCKVNKPANDKKDGVFFKLKKSNNK